VVSSCRFVVFTLLSCTLLAADTSPSYVIQTVAGTDNSGDGGPALQAALGQPEGVTIDKAGNIYFADAATNRVRRVTADGSIQTFAGTGSAGFSGDGGPAAAAALNQPYGLAFDHAGNLYIADLGNARVRRVATDGTIQTVAGGGTLAGTGNAQGGPALSAQLMEPRNVAVDPAGNLYISDFGANQVYRVSSDGTFSLMAGSGIAGFSGDNMSALLAQLNAPAGLAVDSAGALYIADSGNQRVRRALNGVIITVFNTPSPTGVALDSAGTLYVAASSYFGSVSQQIPGITSAVDVAVDQAGNLFAASSPFVLEISPGGAINAIAGSGAPPNFGGDGGPALSAQLNSPSGVAKDSSGDWYIADTANNRIRMVDPTGVISTLAFTATPPLSAPRGLAVDIFGNVLIADSGNNMVRGVSPAGSIFTVAANLKNPVGVATDAQGSVYIADSGDNQIVKVTSGTATTLAQITGPQAITVDTAGSVLVADATQLWKISPTGAATSLIGGLHSPTGIAVAADGTVIIADTAANAVLEWTKSGSLNTIAGSGTPGFSGDSGPALSAQLNGPSGVGIGTNGVLWIADSGNNRMRSLTPSAVAPEIAPTTVVNAASMAAGPIAPGEIVTVFGSGFNPSKTRLSFNGAAATIFYASATQLNALAPSGLTPNSNSSVKVVVDNTTLAESTIRVSTAAPGIFTMNGSGTGQAAVINQDGSLNSASNSAPRETIVSIYATGQGSTPASDVKLTIGGYSAELPYAGPAPGFAGLMQINAQIPGGFLQPGIQPVVLTIGGAQSQAGVTIAIQ
jgi:uncharacterized protein (TIGR03437 family)